MTSHSRAFVLGAIAMLAAAAPSAAAASPFIDGLGSTHLIASAVPANGAAMGDQNPYGVAVVPRTTGKLVRGDVLVSNFNNAQNQQGTGSSIVEISPGGNARVFAVVPRPTKTAAVGLTTALAVLRSGYVVVGSLPAPGGSSHAAGAGALTILDARGHAVKTLAGGDINGPWDMTTIDQGSRATLFVTNVLNGTVKAKGKDVDLGTVVRIVLRIPHARVPQVTSNQVIASGFAEHTDPSALVVGPTGVGVGRKGVLYVADSSGNRIAAVPNALTRSSILGGGGINVSAGGSLNDPLGLAIAPNGDVITANGGDGKIVETTPGGTQSATKTLVPDGGGDLFGLALKLGGHGLFFVNDAGSGPDANSLELLG
jgi:hypothetical protein